MANKMFQINKPTPTQRFSNTFRFLLVVKSLMRTTLGSRPPHPRPVFTWSSSVRFRLPAVGQEQVELVARTLRP